MLVVSIIVAIVVAIVLVTMTLVTAITPVLVRCTNILFLAVAVRRDDVTVAVN